MISDFSELIMPRVKAPWYKRFWRWITFQRPWTPIDDLVGVQPLSAPKGSTFSLLWRQTTVDDDSARVLSDLRERCGANNTSRTTCPCTYEEYRTAVRGNTSPTILMALNRSTTTRLIWYHDIRYLSGSAGFQVVSPLSSDPIATHVIMRA